MISAHDLDWFLELAERCHMTRAAERLGVSQPALSHWLKKLEHELGQPLFRRSKLGMELTTYGEKLKTHGHTLRLSWQDFAQAMERDEKEVRARFRFGIHVSVALFALPPIYRELTKIAPGVKLTLHHGLSRHIAEDIISKRLDVGLVVNPVAHGDLVIKELYKDHVRPYALKGKHQARLIVHPGLFQSQELQGKLKGFPEELIETESLEVAAHLALAGEGIALLPERVASVLSQDKLKAIGEATVVDRHCLVYRPTLRETQAGLKLIEAVKQANFG
jgi:DNA-binding transcriptional LysR family regulator